MVASTNHRFALSFDLKKKSVQCVTSILDLKFRFYYLFKSSLVLLSFCETLFETSCNKAKSLYSSDGGR